MARKITMDHLCDEAVRSATVVIGRLKSVSLAQPGVGKFGNPPALGAGDLHVQIVSPGQDEYI